MPELPRLIELDGGDVLVNPHTIFSVKASKGGAVITSVGGCTLEVKDSFSEVWKLLLGKSSPEQRVEAGSFPPNG